MIGQSHRSLGCAVIFTVSAKSMVRFRLMVRSMVRVKARFRVRVLGLG